MLKGHLLRWVTIRKEVFLTNHKDSPGFGRMSSRAGSHFIGFFIGCNFSSSRSRRNSSAGPVVAGGYYYRDLHSRSNDSCDSLCIPSLELYTLWSFVIWGEKSGV